MSLASLEKSVWAEAKEVFKNPKLRIKDLIEWGNYEPKPHPGEVIAKCPKHGMFVAIKTENDKR